MKERRKALFFFSSRRRHTRYWRDWSSDVCSSDLFRQARFRRCAGRAAAPFAFRNAGTGLAEIRARGAKERPNRTVHAIRGPLRESGSLFAGWLRAVFCFLFPELRGTAAVFAFWRGREVPRLCRTRHRKAVAAGIRVRAAAG